jgi:hypothetical protein
MGAVGGGIWHGVKGARNSPRVRCPFLLSQRQPTWLALTHIDRESVLLARFPPSRPVRRLRVGILASGVACSRRSTVR